MIMYIVIRTYGRGVFQNAIYPQAYGYLDEAEAKCAELNLTADEGEHWVAFPIYKK